MADCPRCREPLVRTTSPEGVTFGCAKCGGREVAFAVLRKIGATADFLRQAWVAGQRLNVQHELPCPHCRRPMAAVKVLSGEHKLAIDVCTFCAAVWFDREELEAVPKWSSDLRELPEAGREQLALFEIQSEREASELGGSADEVPPEWWQWVPWILGLPVQIDGPELELRPWATWAVAAACVVFSAAAWFWLGADAAATWGYIPADPGRAGGLTALTSFFLHGGPFHLVVNMYFLLVFAEHVEDHLGRAGLLLLLAASHVAGVLLHGALDPRSDLPLLGASGGIAGMLAYYAVVFPRARIGILLRFGLLTLLAPRLTLLAIALIALYIFIQIAGAIMQVHGGGGVSHLGHLGGLAVGIAAGAAVRIWKRVPPEFA